MASEHIIKSYDEELRKLSNTIAEMGGLAESQLAAAIDAVVKRDSELAASVGGDVDHPLLRRPSDEDRKNRVALLVITSNRGLAGAYNGSVLRTANATVRSLVPAGLRSSSKK